MNVRAFDTVTSVDDGIHRLFLGQVKHGFYRHDELFVRVFPVREMLGLPFLRLSVHSTHLRRIDVTVARVFYHMYVQVTHPSVSTTGLFDVFEHDSRVLFH